MNEHDYDQDCPCSYCQEQLAAFNAWCDAFEQRWQARKLSRVHVCNGDCGPLADCADERDTSIDRVRELREYLHEALS